MRNLPSRQTLTAALAGGAVAAAISVGPAVAEQTARIAQSISGADIKNSSITGRDVRNGSLTGGDIRNDSLTGSDILSKSITGVEIADDSIGGDKIKADSIGSSDILDNLSGDDIKDRSLDRFDIKQDSIGGQEIDETTLNNVASVRGRQPFRVWLDGGQDVLLTQNGPLALRAQCEVDDGGDDYVRIYATTTEANSFLQGDDTRPGGSLPTDFLQPGTPPEDAELVEASTFTGDTTPEVLTDTNEGYVVDSDGGHYIGVNSDGLALGFRIAGKACFTAGVIDLF